MAEAKICGLTRAADARIAAVAGARYLGVVFAGGPRRLDASEARRVLEGCPSDVGRVGVMGRMEGSAMAELARSAGVDIVQMHGDPTVGDIAEVRRSFDGAIWAVTRLTDALPEDAAALANAADALLIDARAPGALGGTGARVDWNAIAEAVSQLRREVPGRAIILAGGLTPDNVGGAIAALAPDVVDVSSGVESAPGIKDPSRVTDFIAAARASRTA